MSAQVKHKLAIHENRFRKIESGARDYVDWKADYFEMEEDIEIWELSAATGEYTGRYLQCSIRNAIMIERHFSVRLLLNVKMLCFGVAPDAR